MTIRFAPAKRGPRIAHAGPIAKPRARALRRRCVARVANDNCPGAEVLEANRKQLEAALRHFARHGLDAPRAARANAKAALASSDSKAHAHWSAIAATFARPLGPQASANGNSADDTSSTDIA